MRSFHSFRSTASVSEHFFFSFLLAFLLFLLSAGFSVPLRGQETSRIVTVGGEVYRGEVIKETADTIMMRSAGGIAVHIPRSSVRAIAYGEEGEVNMKEEGKRVAAGYWSFGGTLGTPAEANLVLARNVNDDWGVRLSGMYYGGSAGGGAFGIIFIWAWERSGRNTPSFRMQVRLPASPKKPTSPAATT